MFFSFRCHVWILKQNIIPKQIKIYYCAIISMFLFSLLLSRSYRRCIIFHYFTYILDIFVWKYVFFMDQLD